MSVDTVNVELGGKSDGTVSQRPWGSSSVFVISTK